MRGKWLMTAVVGLGVFLWSIVAAASGGLPECTNSLNTCTTNLGTCTNNLNICTTSLGTCTTGLAQAQTNIANCQATLGTCNANQSTAEANLAACLEAFAALPKMVDTCKTISEPGSYVLANSLTSDTDCLVLSADFVTVDLAGFTITGKGTGIGIKDNGSGRKGITVKNGTITNFFGGIGLTNDQGTRVEGMTIFGMGSTAVSLNGAAIVTNNMLFGNQGDGINVGSRGLITGNNCYQNNRAGILAGSGSTVIGNVTGLNMQQGIVGGTGCTIANNTSEANSGVGIWADCPSNVFGNTAFGNSTNLFLRDLSFGSCNNFNNIAP